MQDLEIEERTFYLFGTIYLIFCYLLSFVSNSQVHVLNIAAMLSVIERVCSHYF